MQRDFEQIVREHGDMVLRLAMANTGSLADAEDIYQTVFIRLVHSLDKIEDDAHLRNWLLRATINRCKSLHTSAYRRRELPADELPEPQGGAPDDTADTPATDAMQGLPEKYRTPLHLFYFEGYSVDEIASLLDVRPGTIKSQLSRGRSMLRDILEKSDDD